VEGGDTGEGLELERMDRCPESEEPLIAAERTELEAEARVLIAGNLLSSARVLPRDSLPGA
jgi:hypothetical protein